MNRDEYFYVFESIIYGLALTEILVGLNKMIEARKSIKIYWAHLFFVFTYIATLINTYCWQYYQSPFNLVDSSFTFIIFVVIFPVSYFFAAYQGFPKDFQNVDFKVFFSERRKEILIPALVLQTSGLATFCSAAIAINGKEHFFNYITSSASLADTWIVAFFVLAIAFAAFHKKLWPSEVLAVLGLIAQTYFILFKFRSPI
jgi:hypothetical protein